ncbi:threonine/serine exporter family protein [Bifidobacterium polysaccharolyticum]|uniref:threonine/serine ThrE exporter family protein n=1 Tax=Bifidobacterium polysaccharolyticum TaxID=2750967 RepID=UPI0021BA8D0F|nr:threonine/serine exporter family protein [Bifidobacterium polysaccharolyticum]MCT8157272.1 threonine/serine exporter family protein [Bifidobacterium polysaccharolyticum]
MEDIERDYDKPIVEACIAAKTSLIVRVGMLELGAGTGSFRVREMMHRIAYPMGVHVRADVNLTDIEATCTDGVSRITEVVDLPTTGVNTERIWLLEHFADWLSVKCGQAGTYHAMSVVSRELVDNLDEPNVYAAARKAVKEVLAQDQDAAKVLKDAVATAVRNEDEISQNRIDAAAIDTRTAAGLGTVGSTPRPEDSNDSKAASVSAAAVIENSDSSAAGSAVTESSATSLGRDSGAERPSSGQSASTQGEAHEKARSSESAASSEQSASSDRSTSFKEAVSSDKPASSDKSAYPEPQEAGGITVRQAHERLDLIERRKPLYSPLFSGFASAVACAAFVFLLGGGPYDMAGAFVGAGIGQWVRRQMLGRRINQFFATGVAVIIAALACVGTLRLVGIFDPVALKHDTAYIGAILFVIPGFPLVTGGLDIAKLDFPSGVQRITYAFSIILVATVGGWAVARMVMLNPQGFEPMNLSPLLMAGLRMIAAFCGVWGFSVLFNSPQRMALVAAVIGALTDTMRLEMQDLLHVPPEMAAFLGAFLAGMLATVWRSSVRHGLLPPHLGYPRISLTVPSIVIMVPGLYMYRAMFYLGQFNTLNALDWAFRAFMVIICLPIGLVTARVLTDRSWRYDV